MSISIRVPSYRKVVKEHDKAYTVYAVEVSVNGQPHIVEKRYSEFEDLHRKLKRTIQTPQLPPKAVLKWNQKVLEHRRVGLEAYLQGIIDAGQVPKSFMKFLKIQHRHSNHNKAESLESLENLDEVNHEVQTTHQPVMSFSEAAFAQEQQRSYLPDIVTQGVVQGLYGSADDLR